MMLTTAILTIVFSTAILSLLSLREPIRFQVGPASLFDPDRPVIESQGTQVTQGDIMTVFSVIGASASIALAISYVHARSQ